MTQILALHCKRSITFAAKIFQSQEMLGDGLVGAADREFAAFNRIDAWDHEAGGVNTSERAVTRKAWLELMMFHKTCIPALLGGKAKENRN